ncbi:MULTISPECIES: hypothetical protein [unclassified Blastomonas]|uniref:hypothetical protein n=1 Tax=unclassified Blastomonas TaxID=2626550 RepID=UPI0008248628|nr:MULTISPECIES: hypothetical protein [unclassified Blastomonas]
MIIYHAQDDGWRRRFAFLPLSLFDGPDRQIVWWQWYWSRDMSLYREISLTDPRNRLKELETRDAG